jgi:hypothetical protein
MPDNKLVNSSKNLLYMSYIQHLKETNAELPKILKEEVVPELKWLLSDFFDIQEFTSPNICFIDYNDKSKFEVNFSPLNNFHINEKVKFCFYIETICRATFDDVWEDISKDVDRITEYLNLSVSSILEKKQVKNIKVESEFYPHSFEKNKIVIYFVLQTNLIDILDADNFYIFNDLVKYNYDLINHLEPFHNKRDIYNLIKSNPDLISKMSPATKLIWTKFDKEQNNPSRSKMENQSDMYVFISRPKFREESDGRFIKDIEIERLVKIDPYNPSDLVNLKMMSLRARTQSIDSKVNCIWIEKGAITQTELDSINDDNMYFLRKSIEERMEKIG